MKMSIAVFPLGPLSTNSYVMDNGKDAIAIDVGGDPSPMLQYLQEHKLNLAAICLTHLHFDHLYGVADLASVTGAPVYTPEADAPIADTEAARGGIWGMPPVPEFPSKNLPLGSITIGGMPCMALSTPGHTPGGVSFYFPDEKAVFTGDALFYRSLGRTDFPMGNHQLLLQSIHEKLFTLPDDVKVYPGHGPSTTIGDEKKHNPFCGQFLA